MRDALVFIGTSMLIGALCTILALLSVFGFWLSGPIYVAFVLYTLIATPLALGITIATGEH